MSKADQSCAPCTERSDFAAVEPIPNHCRGEQCSPVLRICCKFRIVGENFFCCRTLLLPWAYYFDERTVFARAQDLL